MDPKKLVVGSPALQYLAAASSNLALVTDGINYGWPSPSLPQILNNTNSSLCITSDEGAVLAVMPLLGTAIGALAASQIVDYLGRQKTIVITSVPCIFAWLMVAFASSVIYLYIARFIAGVADGITFTVVPMYIGEIADPKVRGLLGSSCTVSWILGILFSNLIGSYLSISNAAFVSLSVCILAFSTFIWLPESPYYLLMRNKLEEAKASLRKLRARADVDEEILKLQSYVHTRARYNGRLLDLFRVASNRKAVYIMAGLDCFQQLSGTTAIMFYAQEIFAQAGSDISPKGSSIIYFSVMLAMTMISSSIVDRAGRKPLLIISMTGSMISLFIEGTYFYIKKETSIDTTKFEYLPVAGLIIFVIFFSVGMQSIPFCLLGELFPTSVKAYALCLVNVYFCLLAAIASKFLQVMKDKYGIYMAFWGFTIFSLLGLIFIIIVVPETKGKTLEEIQQYLRGERVRKREEDVEMEKIQINGENEKVADSPDDVFY